MFCPNCGKELGDGAVFCPDCGTKTAEISPAQKRTRTKRIKVSSDFFGSPFSSCIDYGGTFFEWFCAVLIGYFSTNKLISIFQRFSHHWFSENVYTIITSQWCLYAVRVIFILVLFLLFHFSALKKFRNFPLKLHKSFYETVWIILLVTELFLSQTYNILSLYKFFPVSLYFYIIIDVIEFLFPIFTVHLIGKLKSNLPIIPLITLYVYAIPYGGFFEYSFFNLRFTVDGWATRIADITIACLIISLTLIAVFLPKFSKIINVILALLAVILPFALMLVPYRPYGITSWEPEHLSFGGALSIFIDILPEIICALLLSLSIKRKTKTETRVAKKKNFSFKLILISSLSTVAAILIFLFSYGAYGANFINQNLEQWKSDMMSGVSLTSEKNNWDSVSKYTNLIFAKPFIKNTYDYETICENYLEARHIFETYQKFRYSSASEFKTAYKSLGTVDESWQNDSLLSPYYRYYQEMKPDIGEVSVKAFGDSDGKIELICKNKNKAPIGEVKVKLNFTILYVTLSSYSSNEYGRGSETVTIENVDGDGQKTFYYEIDPDDYYDSYRSYAWSTFWSISAEVISIE